MNVVEINAESQMSSFLSLKKIEESEVSALALAVLALKKLCIDPIFSEMVNGGLDTISLNINGNPIAHRHAWIINKNLETVYESLLKICETDLITKAEQHREEELKKYAAKLKVKVEGIDKELTKYYRYKDYYESLHMLPFGIEEPGDIYIKIKELETDLDKYGSLLATVCLETSIETITDIQGK